MCLPEKGSAVRRERCEPFCRERFKDLRAIRLARFVVYSRILRGDEGIVHGRIHSADGALKFS